MKIAGVGTAFPAHYYDQQTLLEALKKMLPRSGNGTARLDRLHRRVLVGGRHLALPLEEYAGLSTWGQANDAWIRVAGEVGEQALRQALERAGLAPRDIDAIFFVSVTGVATPSVDCQFMNRMGLRPDVKRVPIFGLGCVAGAAGIARAADYVKAYPDQVAVVVSVELCSLTLQTRDLSVANMIATGLFGDGAAAVVVTGTDRPATGPSIVATRSVFYPDSGDVMGWRISEKGFGIILSARVPEVVREYVQGDTDRFLSPHGLTRGDITWWVCHSGGPRVLEAMEDTLELPAGALGLTWKSLETIGNLSSASVLMVLDETLRTTQPPAGSPGLMIAMGPGFCSELLLLRWPG
ncbi:MAG: type III polyketide synthase [Acidobacteriota bacterium]